MDKNQLPFLIRLLDDESPAVRSKVLAKLYEFGPSLEAQLKSLNIALAPEQRQLLRKTLPSGWQGSFKEAWLRLLEMPDSVEQLESGLDLIVQYQDGPEYAGQITKKLDELEGYFKELGHTRDIFHLNAFLFHQLEIEGTESDYYNPRNSNLLYVLEAKRGIPISLACLLILMGHRLGLDIHGCNVPGHFLARSVIQGQEFIFDCFSQGHVLTHEEVESLKTSTSPGFMEILRTPAPVPVILTRALRNLIVAYEHSGQPEHASFFKDLLQETQRHQQRLAQEDLT